MSTNVKEIVIQVKGLSSSIVIGANLNLIDYLRPPLKFVLDKRLEHRLRSRLEKNFSSSLVIPLLINEQQKKWQTVINLAEQLLQLGIDRETTIVAIGGGTLADLVGFTASILLRGLSWVYLPTTLLAQADVALSGKNAINTAQGKNLIGTFHFPRQVICDVGLLDSLPERQWSAGYAEIVKHALIIDEGFFTWLEANYANKTPDFLIELVAKSLTLKSKIIDHDWFETDPHRGRQLLNLGHSFAHGLETLTEYKDLLHGEAVSLGLAAAFDMATFLKFIPPRSSARVKQHLEHRGLPINYQLYLKTTASKQSFTEILWCDKKRKQDKLIFILPRSIGQVFVYEDPQGTAFKEFLERCQ